MVEPPPSGGGCGWLVGVGEVMVEVGDRENT